MNKKAQKLIRRYKKNYAIAAGYIITEEMILHHWELEKHLRSELLKSNIDNRWEVFEKIYSKLYSEIYWLNREGADDADGSLTAYYEFWVHIIGQPPLMVYEVGSGRGGLIHYLASCGFECRGTEITSERGQKWITASPNLSWGTSDGVHLDRFEPKNRYDIVISDQVIEHLHPDDITGHFKGVYSILKTGGRYIFSTPNSYTGPSDVTRVFQLGEPMGTHLKEYTYVELSTLLKQCGFRDTSSVLRVPMKIHRFLGTRIKPHISHIYMRYLCSIERLISALPTRWLRRTASTVSVVVLFAPGMFIVTKK